MSYYSPPKPCAKCGKDIWAFYCMPCFLDDERLMLELMAERWENDPERIATRKLASMGTPRD